MHLSVHVNKTHKVLSVGAFICYSRCASYVRNSPSHLLPPSFKTTSLLCSASNRGGLMLEVQQKIRKAETSVWRLIICDFGTVC